MSAALLDHQDDVAVDNVVAHARLENVAEDLALTIMVVDLSPSGAEVLLDGNTRNRTLREHNVKRITADLLSGDWTFDSSPIRVSREGTLLDGQHRLTALVRAAEQNPAITMRVLVIIGLDSEAQMVMDGGVKRTAGEQLGLRGIPNYLHVAATGAVINSRRAGFWKDTGYKAHAIPLSHAQAYAIYEENPELMQEAILMGNRATKLLHRSSPASFSGIYYELAQIDREWAIDFYNRIAESKTEGHGDAVFALIRRFHEDNKAGRKMSMAQQIFLILRCWNADRQNERLSRVRLTNNGSPLLLPQPI